jgi:uncharacterized protein YjbI with pentapeptide repeats
LNEIGNNKEFVEWISKVDKEYDLKHYENTNYRPADSMLYLNNLVLEKLKIRDKSFLNTEFKSCVFFNCNFTSSLFFSSTLIKCKFINCHFTWTNFVDVDLFSCDFNDCVIVGMEISDAVVKKTIFRNCTEVLDLRLRSGRERDFTFKSCYLHHLDIEPIESKFSEKFDFTDCMIKESSFDRIYLTESVFKDCNLSLNQFSSCSLSSGTFSDNNNIPGNEFNLIDIRTILNSNPLGEKILEDLFGIHNGEIKEYLIDLTSKIEFQSIFISYSFNDSSFAKTINEALQRRGIMTFLWENDSKAGKPLENIMSSGIKEKDRILFISSEHSLKSKACHFELTEGRKKQEITWGDVLFPIHIDNFLFEVKKNAIRPVEKQNEYWENITELKRLNSLSFVEFKDSNLRDEIKFEKQIFRLIEGLRKTK